jgi:serine phosphatase RsbU (regulator of sigma subunit)
MHDYEDPYFMLAYGVLDAAAGSFRHVSAGHPGPVLIRDQAIRNMESENLPAGVLRKAEFDEKIIELMPGDRVYLHSDGIANESNLEGELFGRERLHAELLSGRSLPLAQSIDSLINAVVTWRGKETLSDDVTVLAIEAQAAP